MQELDDYIHRVQNLPPAPAILPQLLNLLSARDVDNSRVVELITFDPALTANVLRVCNSAFLGASRPADDLNEAVMRLGFRPIFDLVAAVTAGRALKPAQKGYGINEGELWKHSVTTAVAAQLIARELGDDESQAFTAGLLHDIGKIILAGALEHIYLKLIQETETHQQSMIETEKRLLGVNHAEIGGRLLARWKFPPGIVTAVWSHHAPALARGYERIASFVYLGNMIAYFLGNGYGHQAFALRGRAEALSILNLKPDDLPRQMIRTLEAFETIENLTRI